VLSKYRGALGLWLIPLGLLALLAGLYAYGGWTHDLRAAEQCRAFFWLYLTVFVSVLILKVYAEVER